jgi:hypothetical protein
MEQQNGTLQGLTLLGPVFVSKLTDAVEKLGGRTLH